MSQVKVVELKVEGDRIGTVPPAVHTVRQKTKKQLNELLQDLFNNADDALFEFADRSQSDVSQEMYFDSMRAVRLHRKTLVSTFMRAFADSFQTAFSDRADESEHAPVDTDSDDYALLGQDELEMSVAVSGIVSKVTSQYSLAVMLLTKRLNSLTTSSSITERINPLGPYSLSTVFSEALAVLDVDIKIRIILMKLFERFVMEHLGPMYEAANEILASAGVLPNLDKNQLRETSSEPPAAPSATTEQDEPTTLQAANVAQQPSASSIGMSTLQSLMAATRGAPTYSGNPRVSDSPIMVLPTMQPNELVGALSKIQSLVGSDHIDITHVPKLGDVGSLVLSQAGGEEKSLGRADEDIVDFVGLLFDYILNDRNLAIPMKALIGRLQIPIVKLSIIDKSFFEKSGHPARMLLNELSSAGIGWSSARELKRDALYDKIESVVLRVLNEFADNPDIFSELLSGLRAFVSTDTRRSVLVEQRVKEAETGKAKTHDAKIQVQDLVNQKASGLRLPSEAGRFISQVWSRVLTFRMVKYDQSDAQWTDGVAILDRLLWALQPHAAAEDIDQRDTCVPNLIAGIRNGMDELAYPREEIDEFLSWLNDHLTNLSHNDRAYLEEDERPEMDIAEELVEEIILATPVPEVDEQSIEPATAAQLKLITEGSWVEIEERDNDKLRCKLATITRPGDNYVFVNRRGMKVLQKGRTELAEMVQEERLHRIDESQVFDRALQTVIGNLRQMQREQSA